MSSHEEMLERQFDEAMLGIYEAGKRLKPPYHATRFRQMVGELGGRETANRLLASNQPSEGFTQLFLRGRRLDLSVENLVLTRPWRELFEEDQLAEARRRLQEHAPPPRLDVSLLQSSSGLRSEPSVLAQTPQRLQGH